MDYETCGGCGAADPKDRCIGCLHDFGGQKTMQTVAMTDRDEVERLAIEVGQGYARVTKNHPNGDFVRFRDYEALRQRAEAAERDRLLMAQKYDKEHSDPALMSKIIMQNIENRFVIEDLQTALTEARAQVAAAWEAGRDAAAAACDHERHDLVEASMPAMALGALYSRRSVEALTPPADASAALTARLDAEWNAAIEAAAQICDDLAVGYATQKAAVSALADAARDIRALRRDANPPSP